MSSLIPESVVANEPKTNSIMVLAFLSLITSLGVLSNLTILATVWLDHRLRNSTCCFICSLAVADLVVLTFAVPREAYQDFLGFWPYSEILCDVTIVVDLTFSTASLLSVMLLAVDRYMSIRMPFSYSHWMTKKLVALTLIAVWTISIVTIAVPISLSHVYNHHELEGEKIVCLAKFMPYSALMVSFFNFGLPCTAMVYIYTRLYLQAKAASDEIRKLKKSLLRADDVESRPAVTVLQRFRNDYKAAMTVGLIMGSYLVCWLPFFVVEILHSFNQNCCSDLAFKVGIWMGFVNSALNPIIYGLMDKKIRAAFLMFVWQSSIAAMPRISDFYKDRDLN
ncbi:Hypothetical predicted protein [Cloeon dipterum]|uniref:G-protein coupled receptors family 1 profile domain-containing protein n=1 Tax=Cloeon dipterum TaxID=197152 RepID=A0A8S1CFM2_9INSE|nr:Hypothetical predicted protein [Cloeon dipterum]